MPETTANHALPYPVPSDPPDGAAQIEALARATDGALHDVEDALADRVTAIEDSAAWTRYTPTIETDSNPMSWGNGSISAAYRLASAKTVEFRIRMTRGSTTNLGTGSFYIIGLPPGINVVYAADAFTAFVYNAFKYTPVTGFAVTGGTNAKLCVSRHDGVRIGPGSFTWAAGDLIVITGRLTLA